MTFQLDTSGRVRAAPNAPHAANWYCWSDLTPFAQGYVEAMLRDLDARRMAHYQDRRRRGLPEAVPICPRYSWLAPATVERITVDCAKLAALYGFSTEKQGRLVWWLRNEQMVSRPGFPPLTPFLSDDGLIMLREVEQ